MECPAEGAGPVLAHLSLLRPESAAGFWKHAQHHRRWAADRSRAFRQAWVVGQRALGQGIVRNMIGDLASKAVFWGEAPEAPWTALGGVLEVFGSLGRLGGGFHWTRGLWDALRRLLGRSWG